MAICTNCGLEAETEFKFCPDCGSQRVVDDLALGDPLLGRTLGGKYRVVESIGSGSMGRVYRAEHVALKKRVALKVLHRDMQVSDEAMSRFQREGIAAGQISHPGVLQIFDFERTEDGICYLAMEFVDGIDMKEWLKSHAPLEPDDSIEIMLQLLGILAEAHKHGVVHRDLKPENIMVQEDEHGAVSLKVLDFGLSKLVDTKLDLTAQTIPGRLMGTPLYMAPEQWRGEAADHRSDLYAATLIFYEMLAGRPPFAGSDLTEIMVQSTQREPPALSSMDGPHEIPDSLEEFVQIGLVKDRDERFQTAREMLHELRVAIGEEAAAPAARTRRNATSRAAATRAGGSTAATRTARRSAAGRTAGGRSAGHAQAGAGGASPIPKIAIGLGAVGLLAFASWAFLSGGPDNETPLLSMRDPGDLELRETDYLALLRDSRASLRANQPTSAMSQVRKAANMPCADPEALLVRALVFRAEGDDAAAKRDLEEALAEYPDYVEAKAWLGWIAFDAGDIETATTHFEAALALDSSSGLAHAGKAATLLAVDDAAAARSCLETSGARESDHALVAVWRGRVALALDDVGTARSAFTDAKRMDSSVWQALEGLGDIERRSQNSDQAARQYEAALELQENASSVRRKLAMVRFEDGRFTEARAALDRLLGSRGRGDDFVLAGLIEQAIPNATAALTAFDTAITRGVSDPVRVQTLRANLQLETDDVAGAIATCESASRDGADNAAFYTAWGLALFSAERFAEAAEKLELAVERNGTDTFVRFTLGVLYMDYLGDDDFAAEQFRAYTTHGGEDPRVRDWLRRLER